MTSSHDRLIRASVALAGLCASLLLVTAGARTAGASAAPQAPLAAAARLLARGNATAAIGQAQAAVAAAPKSEEAHRLLVQARLVAGDGLAAEAAIDRAAAAGVPGSRLAAFRAEARLLQGDNAGAVALTARADRRDAGTAWRVRARALADGGDLDGAARAFARAQAVASDDPLLWVDIGRVRYRAGDLEGASAAAVRAVALGPNNVPALQLRGELVRSQFGLRAGLPWFAAAVARDPYAHDALIEQAATLGELGETGAMLAAVRRAMGVRPASPQGYYLQAVLAARAGNFALARSVLQRAGDTLNGVPGALLLGASLDIEDGAHGQAVAKLRELVARQPGNLPARRLLALSLLRSDAAADALDVLRPLAVRSDADSYTLTLAARAFERTGARDWAARMLDRAATPVLAPDGVFASDDSAAALAGDAVRRPGDPSVVIPYIRALLADGQGAAARSAAVALAQRNLGAPAAALVLGDVWAATGNWGAAADAYAGAAELRFDEPTLLRMVDALDRAGRRQAAAEALALFRAQNPQNVAAGRLAAHWQIAAGRFEDAVDTLEGLRARIGNRDAALLAELAHGYAGLGDAEAATGMGAAAYALQPANPAVADAYGWALHGEGADASAAALLAKAVRIAPGHAGLRWHLAQVEADLGRRQSALGNARAALADPSFTERKAAQALIAALG